MVVGVDKSIISSPSSQLTKHVKTITTTMVADKVKIMTIEVETSIRTKTIITMVVEDNNISSQADKTPTTTSNSRKMIPIKP